MEYMWMPICGRAIAETHHHGFDESVWTCVGEVWKRGLMRELKSLSRDATQMAGRRASCACGLAKGSRGRRRELSRRVCALARVCACKRKRESARARER
eukprot:6190733-Pleurochrysis_carterae.AAC.1